MGIVRRLQEMSYVCGEPAVDRQRKTLLVPTYTLVGFGAFVWLLASVAGYVPTMADDGSQNQLRKSLLMTAALMFVAATFPVGLYVVYTRRISRRMCECTAVCAAAAVLLQDWGMSLSTERSLAYVNVVVLDLLLVSACRPSHTKAVVVTTVVWMLARAFIDAENVSGTCQGCYARFSVGYVRSAAANFFVAAVVFVVDFHFTRGFATSMSEQKALVEASVRVSEAAAVLLSRYQTEATRELLEGSDGEQLPPLLRSALTQLVDNLAQYLPYLPQSCLPGGGGGGAERSDGCSVDATPMSTSLVPGAAGSESGRRPDAKAPLDATSVSGQSDAAGRRLSSPRPSSPLRESSLGSALMSNHVPRAVPQKVAWEAAQRKVSLIAVNSKSFLRSSGGDRHEALSFIRAEVDEFLGAVAAERGVVDLISGDHLFANFNASRLCTTHRVSAARVTWGMAGQGEGAAARRSAAACSGAVLCGDFGTSEMRRFMVLGAAFNTLQCLERVAAQLGTVLVDEAVGADADVGSVFFRALVERLTYAKRDAKPFLVWQLAGRREEADGPAEWMYELDRRARNPHTAWNQTMAQWLNFGAPAAEDELQAMQKPFHSSALTAEREQSYLHEAGVGGGTVAFCVGDVQSI